MHSTTSCLFEGIAIGDLQLKNRLVVPAMGTNYASEDGIIDETGIAYYQARAKGGFGLVIVEVTAVSPTGRHRQKQFGLWNDKQANKFKSLINGMHYHGAAVFVQLNHAGGQSDEFVTEETPSAPSAIIWPQRTKVPHELNWREITEIIEAFGESALRAKMVGADGIEIHGAHGYLINQFVSRFYNKRTDHYGGSITGRMRFLLEVLEQVRYKVGSQYPVGVRISANERVCGGQEIYETKIMAQFLEEADADYLHVSTGVSHVMPWIVSPYYVPEAYNINNVEAIKRCVSIPVVAVGRINNVNLASQIIKESQADLIAMGRASIADPDFPNKIRNNDAEKVTPCIACLQGCIGKVHKNEPMQCLVNPRVSREKDIHCPLIPKKRKRVFIVGGGPAGIEAAIGAANKNHEVTLWEKETRLGGVFYLASLPPYKSDVSVFLSREIARLNKSGVSVYLGENLTQADVNHLKPDVLVLAHGGQAVIPAIPGIEMPHVHTAVDVLAGKVYLGNKVVIIGGGAIGCETATYLGNIGKDVTILELEHEICRDLEKGVKYFLYQELMRMEVKVILRAKILNINFKEVNYDHQGVIKVIKSVDTVVVAAGVQPNRIFGKTNPDMVKELYIIGDAKQPRDALTAIIEGYQTGSII